MSETIVSPNEVWNLPYPETGSFEVYPDFVTRAKDGSFTHSEIKEFCDSEQDGILLERDLLERITDDRRAIIEKATFHEVSEWYEGRQDSAHQVNFGRLTLLSSAGREVVTDVAIKPFLIWRRGADNEAAAMIKMPQTTGINSFELLGMIRIDGKVAVVSRFEEQVTSLDNLEWNLGIDTVFRESISVVDALQKCALTLARIHQVGMVHNDAQIKNMAVVTEADGTCKVRLIDLENAKWRNTKDPIDRQKFLDDVHSDVSALVGSLLKKGLWRDAGYSDKARAIQAVFTEPYLSFLRHPGNKDQVYDFELHNEVEDRVEDVLEQI